ncbi:NAD(P)H-dependent glycerol-3-phosphate dehydrogenase [Balneatrix alpica]|uniref:Glycerol-3-phosphate dehydrogenase [NAD(P)+] n=1 Tax=Balneatrix alpica TaxID=75684 RepID=A0ABV5Z8Q0_9GAMM|nr:NAD(P)H-dependent glycerol-3-phosphate dehydrogenase [Balneatrix alpica]
MQGQTTVAVLGGGSFGTVLANIAAQNGHSVRLWLRDEALIEAINRDHENARYMPGYPLSPQILAVSDLAQAVSGAEILVMAVPSKAYREVARQCRALLTPTTVVLSTAKGIEAGSFALMSQILAEELPQQPLAVLSGPNLAKEIAQQQLTATVVASADAEVRNRIQQTFKSPFFRLYANNDMYGVELGGALKNIYAIATGMGAALGMGENTRSMLITRSLAEMSRFAVRLGANPLTFLGMAGVGDLIVTCMSPLSRNYRVGYALGQGRSLEDAVAELGEVAEGVGTLQTIKAWADELEVYMPLVQGLYQVVFNGQGVDQVVKMLMTGEQSSDVEFVLPRGN